MKIYYFFILILINIKVFSQSEDIPNRSFEDWTNKSYGNKSHMAPNLWTTNNDSEFKNDAKVDTFVVFKSNEKTSGNNALLMKPVTIGSEQYNANVISISDGAPFGFTSFSLPKSIFFDYKTHNASDEQASYTVTVQGGGTANPNIYAVAFGILEASANWTTFEIEMDYDPLYADEKTASIIITLLCGAPENPGFSEFYVDNMSYKSTTGVRTMFNEQQTNAYPNPAKELISIELSKDLIVEDLSVFSITGKKQDVTYSTTIGKVELNINHLNSGLYFVKTQTDKGIFSTSIVVE
ncbi:MAG: hypothetical protein ACJAZ3_000919 [Sphingobacteriales bacterium]|jgi:hypothetical protein